MHRPLLYCPLLYCPPQEVAETFLRCVKERFAEDNVIIELNALKIAEDRTFADCARYILTTLLALCLPAPAWVSPEYVSLFIAPDAPDTGAKEGKLALLGRFKKQMTKWHALLHRFLTSEDDQVCVLGLWTLCVCHAGRQAAHVDSLPVSCRQVGLLAAISRCVS